MNEKLSNHSEDKNIMRRLYIRVPVTTFEQLTMPETLFSFQ